MAGLMVGVLVGFVAVTGEAASVVHRAPADTELSEVGLETDAGIDLVLRPAGDVELLTELKLAFSQQDEHRWPPLSAPFRAPTVTRWPRRSS
ncbi:hypothetical protein H4N64_30325 [Streptomyces sp. PSKA01]|uniref:Uncharacterized protein n=1 Tax=Streptomyces cupreus TaxID=2759956 RepID=A0A7X1MC23_9ACTN|nr:hypothetical protein [Streptomyces cupreus]